HPSLDLAVSSDRDAAATTVILVTDSTNPAREPDVVIASSFLPSTARAIVADPSGDPPSDGDSNPGLAGDPIAVQAIGQSGTQVGIETVVIDHSANPARSGGEGRVDYVFEMSRFEIKNTQYSAFLNAVARQEDPFGLFATEMQNNADGGIARTQQNERFSYAVRVNMADKPVNGVTWLSAARFVNWLENGQPRGHPGPATTEDGTYDLSGGDAAYASATRRAGAEWALPNANEWTKAALYDPTLASNNGYWKFATRSNDCPLPSPATLDGLLVTPGPNTVNYDQLANWNGSLIGNVVAVGSAGPTSRSFFGAADLHGNVAEWNEHRLCFDGMCGREVRGGSFAFAGALSGAPVHGLLMNFTPVLGMGGETFRGGQIGFRVVRIP
ncbi:MAG: SUMF1/EgtB/PvdO family nonheme iron enzyme, partial [Phycisphaerae bacterium]